MLPFVAYSNRTSRRATHPETWLSKSIFIADIACCRMVVAKCLESDFRCVGHTSAMARRLHIVRRHLLASGTKIWLNRLGCGLDLRKHCPLGRQCRAGELWRTGKASRKQATIASPFSPISIRSWIDPLNSILFSGSGLMRKNEAVSVNANGRGRASDRG